MYLAMEVPIWPAPSPRRLYGVEGVCGRAGAKAAEVGLARAQVGRLRAPQVQGKGHGTGYPEHQHRQMAAAVGSQSGAAGWGVASAGQSQSGTHCSLPKRSAVSVGCRKSTPSRTKLLLRLFT